MKILIVDDDENVTSLVSATSTESGHQCVVVNAPRDAVEIFRETRPDVVVLDIMMPRLNGFEICKSIREIDPCVPVLFLSAKGDLSDKRTGFAIGGDDYVTKPFDDEELIVRLEALNRRAHLGSAATLCDEERDSFVRGDFVLDAREHRITFRGHVLELTPKEFDILLYLAKNASCVVGKEELIEAVWGREYLKQNINLAVYIRRIREKIEPDPAKPRYVETVWGVGYRFSE